MPAALRNMILLLFAQGTSTADIAEQLAALNLPTRRKATVCKVLKDAGVVAFSDSRRVGLQRLDAAVDRCIYIGGPNYGYRQLRVDVEELLGERVSRRALIRSMERINPWAAHRRR